MSKTLRGKHLGGRAYLTAKLMDCDLSRRQSVAVVRVVLERMIHGLRRGEAVEFPFGKLTRVEKHFSQWWDAVDDWPANREPYAVDWELSPEGREQLCGPLEKEERAYLEAAWQAPRAEKQERRGRKKQTPRTGK